MIDNIIPIHGKQHDAVVSGTAAKLRAMADRAESNPEKYKYLIVLTSSGCLDKTDWFMAGRPTLLVLLGLLEVVKDEIHTLFSLSDRERPD